MTFTTPKPEVPRDRWKRPLIVPPGGGKAVAYTRCTTFVGGIEDTFKISQWSQRHLAIGLAMRPDLLATVGIADLDDRETLNGICDEAKTSSGASDKARLGTWLHSVTEAVDKGMTPEAAIEFTPMPELAYPKDPTDYVHDVRAYVEATKDLKPVLIEAFCVLDNLKIGGTPDRVVKVGNRRYIADLKTGSVELGALKIAAQLAVYARSATYDVETGERGTHGAEVDRGIVIHMPAGEGTCTLYWVDLLAGWEAVRVCRDIREQRTRKFRDLMDPIPVGPIDPKTLPTKPVKDGEQLIPSGPTPKDVTPEQYEASLRLAILDAPDRAHVEALWRRHASHWTEALSALAGEHLASLGK